MQIVDKLKARWGISSTWQIFIILVVFSCTGFTAVYARHFLFDLLGVVESDPFWFKTLIWVLVIFPVYNLFLLIYGALFGQFDFFWRFFKKTIRRFVPGKSAS